MSASLGEDTHNYITDDGSRSMGSDLSTGASSNGRPRSPGVSLSKLEAPRTKLVISSTSSLNSPNSNRGSKTQRKIIESSVGNRDGSYASHSITLINEEDDNDEITVDSTIARLEEARQIKVNEKYRNKPLPSFIKLSKETVNPDVEREKAIFAKSASDATLISSHHLHAGKMGLRRGTSNHLHVDEHTRATSVVSGQMEKLRIRGCDGPPRDYLKKLDPIEHKRVLKKYGYGSSPSKKHSTLTSTLKHLYSNENLGAITMVQYPLALQNQNIDANIPLHGPPDKTLKGRIKRAKMKNKYNNGGPQDNSGMPGVDMEDNYNYDGFGHNINMMTPLTDRSNEFSLNHSGDVGDTPYQHNMSNIDLDNRYGHISAPEEDYRHYNADSNNRSWNQHEGFSDFNNNGSLNIDLQSSTALSPDGNLLVEETAPDRDMRMLNNQHRDALSPIERIRVPGGPQAGGTPATPQQEMNRGTPGAGGVKIPHMFRNMFTNTPDQDERKQQELITPMTTNPPTTNNSTAFAANYAVNDVDSKQPWPESITGGLLGAPSGGTQPGVDPNKVAEKNLRDYIVPYQSTHSMGLRLYKNADIKLVPQGRKSTKKAAPNRRRQKILKEKKKQKSDSVGLRSGIVHMHGKNLDVFKLRKPSKTAATSPDGRRGALPPPSAPYYDPATYRLPESLKDKLDSMIPEVSATFQFYETDDDLAALDMQSFASQRSSNGMDASDMSQLPDPLDKDLQAWRKPFIGRKIKFPDAVDTDDEDEYGLGDDDDNFDFEGEGSFVDSQEDGEDEGDEESDEGEGEGEGGGGGEDGGPQEKQEGEGDSEGKDGLSDQVDGSSATTRPHTNMSTASDVAPTTASTGNKNEGADGNSAREGSVVEGKEESFVSIDISADPHGAFPGASPAASRAGTAASSTKPGSTQSQSNLVHGDTSTPQTPADTSILNSIDLVRQSITETSSVPPATNNNNTNVLGGNSVENSLSLNSLTVSQTNSISQESNSQVTDETLPQGYVRGEDGKPRPMTAEEFEAQVAQAKIEAEFQEQKRKMILEARRDRQRAKKLAELEEEKAMKTQDFIEKHVHSDTAKRTDYKFPEDGIQKPGVGEAYVKHRDYPVDSFYMTGDGVLTSQKDDLRSNLLDTVLQDVRLTSPVYGTNAKPMTPIERLNSINNTTTLFQITVSGSPPQSPQNPNRKLVKELEAYQQEMVTSEDFAAMPAFSYDLSSLENVIPEIPAAQRFRMQAEEERANREREALRQAEIKAIEKKEREEASLKAAGIKKPRRKKLQEDEPEVLATPLPQAYSIGRNTKTGKVGAFVGSAYKPSRVHKPKRHYTKEVRLDTSNNGEEKESNDDTHTSPSKPDHQEGSPIAEPPKIAISGGVPIYTRDNTLLDPESYKRLQELRDQTMSYSIWTQNGDANAVEVSGDQILLERTLKTAELVRSRSSSAGDGSAPNSRDGRRSTMIGVNGDGRRSTTIGVSGTVANSILNMSPESQIAGNAAGGGLAEPPKSPPVQLSIMEEEEEEG